MTDDQPELRLPQDDYEPSGPAEEAWLEHRDKVHAALIEFEGCGVDRPGEIA